MEWLGNGASHPDKEFNPTSSGFSSACPHQQQPASHPCLSALCQNQQRCVKASILSSWRLAEAQDQLCSLEVHSSESVEQEHARTLTGPTELTHTLEEWRRKESMLGGQEPNRSLVLGAVGSWDVFDRSIINVQKQPVEMDQDKCKSFQQKYEQELRYFGMLRRWDDSQRFLADTPQLICEETANYLILWCMRLQQEGKEALMDQVAHQAVVMQFILEMASNSQQDPRGCFRHFFHKAKEGQDVYLEVFHTELEAFKHRVKEYSVTCRSNTANVEEQNSGTYCRPDPKESTDYFSPQVADFTAKRHFNAGLWTNSGWLTKDDTTETDDMRMMETS